VLHVNTQSLFEYQHDLKVVEWNKYLHHLPINGDSAPK
jgi:hypothetical protein